MPGPAKVSIDRRAHPEIGRRIDQHLKDRERLAEISESDHRGGGEIAAGAVAADGDTLRVRAQFARMREAVFRSSNCVIECGRELVLGRQSVVDRDDIASRPMRDLAAENFVRVEVAADPAAAVDEQEQGSDSRYRANRAAPESDARREW